MGWNGTYSPEARWRTVAALMLCAAAVTVTAAPALERIEIFANARGLAVAFVTAATYDGSYKFSFGKDSEGKPAALAGFQDAVSGLKNSVYSGFPAGCPVRRITVEGGTDTPPVTVTLTLATAAKGRIEARIKGKKVIGLLSKEPFFDFSWNSDMAPPEPASAAPEAAAESPAVKPGRDVSAPPAAPEITEPPPAQAEPQPPPPAPPQANLQDIRLIRRGTMERLLLVFDIPVEPHLLPSKPGVLLTAIPETYNKVLPAKIDIKGDSVFRKIELAPLKKSIDGLQVSVHARSGRKVYMSAEGAVIAFTAVADGAPSLKFWSAVGGETAVYEFIEAPEPVRQIAEMPAEAPSAVEPEAAGQRTVPEVQPPAPSSAIQRITVVRDRVNMRAGPGTGETVRQVLKNRTAADLLEEKDGWVRIRTDDGAEGWVYGSMVGESAGAAAAEQEAGEKPAQENEAVPAAVTDTPATEVAESAPVAESQNGKTIKYNAFGRDPFIPLTDETMEELPDATTLTLVGILYDDQDRLALLEEAKEGGGRAYAMREKERVKNGYLFKIQRDQVVFVITEFDISRTFILKLKEESDTRKRGK
jgi:hypothetical protein